VNPGGKVEAVIDPVDGAEDLEERLLGQVLGQLPVAQQPEGETVDGLVVALEEGVEGGDVARQVVTDQVEIRGAFGYSRCDVGSTPDSAKSIARGIPPTESRAPS
jgi:hypothetical protein